MRGLPSRDDRSAAMQVEPSTWSAKAASLRAELEAAQQEAAQLPADVAPETARRIQAFYDTQAAALALLAADAEALAMLLGESSSNAASNSDALSLPPEPAPTW